MSPKRSKLSTAIAAGAGLGIAAWLREPSRREKLRQMATGVRDTVLPPREEAAAPDEIIVLPDDEAHAPGHRHLQPPSDEEPPASATHPAEHTVVDHRPGQVHKG